LSLFARCVAAVLACCAAIDAHAEGEVSVVCSVQLDWCQAVASAFTRETGITVHMTQKAFADALRQMEFERADPRHDVWYGGAHDAHLRAAELGLTTPYRSPLLPQLHDWAVRVASRSDFRSVGLYAAVLGIAYNHDTLAKKRLPAPGCFADLRRPEYRGELRSADPHRSSTGYETIVAFVQMFGEDRAFDLLRAIDRNVAAYANTQAGAIRAAARGEAVIAVAYLHDALTEVAAGFPIRFVVPCEGAGYSIGAMSIVDGGPNAENARRFYDWALTPGAQELGSDTHNFEMPANRAAPQSTLARDVGEIRFAPYDFAAHDGAFERARLLGRWDREAHETAR
jgi:iron(III) transport system substrate-binding protein